MVNIYKIEDFIYLNNSKYSFNEYLMNKFEKRSKYFIYLKPLNLSIREYISSINNKYKYTLKDFENIFEKYNETNNGVILNNNVFNNNINIINNISNKSKSGGTINSSLLNSTQIKSYCDLINNNKDDEDIFEDYIIHSNINNSIIPFINIIDTFNRPVSDKITISYNPIIDPENNNPISNDRKYKFEKTYDCYKYNLDIVKAYENNFLNNLTNINSFIYDQRTYINNLDIGKRRIITDYTYNDSYGIYQYYINNNKAPGINDYLYDAIGDCFYYQINKVLNNKGDYQTFQQKTGKTYDQWLLNDRIFFAGSFFKPVSNSDIINEDFWTEVIKMFINDVNDIIRAAPELKYDIYCYRGSLIHYIDSSGSAPITDSDMILFKTDRICSFTFNFDVAKNFANMNPCINDSTPDTAVIYRTTILKGCKVLFLTPLSYFTNEIEILLPGNCVYLYNQNNLPQISYNNINKKYGICSKDQNKYRSMDVCICDTSGTL